MTTLLIGDTVPINTKTNTNHFKSEDNMGAPRRRVNCTEAVKKAKERKRRKRIIREEFLQLEADQLGITVHQLLAKKGRQVNQIIQTRRATVSMLEQPHRLRYPWE